MKHVRSVKNKNDKQVPSFFDFLTDFGYNYGNIIKKYMTPQNQPSSAPTPPVSPSVEATKKPLTPQQKEAMAKVTKDAQDSLATNNQIMLRDVANSLRNTVAPAALVIL